MKVQQVLWSGENDIATGSPSEDGAPDLVLIFGGRALLDDPRVVADLRGSYSESQILGCSTAGEIHGTEVGDDSIVVTCIWLEKTRLQTVCAPVQEAEGSFDVGLELANALVADDLAHVFVLSDGLNVNGTELAKGLASGLGADVPVTGGLSADGDRFDRTVVMSGRGAGPNRVAAMGLYGDSIRIGHGSLGGWDPFGPSRLVTRSQGNVLYELDGRPALDLYKRYLGDHADGLPAAGLLFPLSIDTPGSRGALVRTILGVDEDTGSMIFAGDVPQGSIARLMKANFDRLIDGAAGAATVTGATNGSAPDLALLVSCVGRRLVLKQRVEEELEAVRDVLGPSTVLAGFYSYGEISPLVRNASCELHNQTMTITTFSEV